MYLLDTNVLIYYLRNEYRVARRVDELLRRNSVLISSVVEAELLSWPELTQEDQDSIVQALANIPSIPIDSELARFAAKLRRIYRIPLIDCFIAATAMRTNATLLTRNIHDFKKITGLKKEKI